ncbi:hypothetical protein HXX76_014317, partial [Chlamydomonas incerta]
PPPSLTTVTGLVDLYPGTSVEPFWEAVDPDSATALLTPLELMQQLEQAGYRLSYRRIPLSRERTPEAADVDALHAQLTQAASDAAENLRGEEAAALAGLGSNGPGIVVHLVLSRTATGSSASFVAAACGTYLSRQQSGEGGGAWALRGTAEAAVAAAICCVRGHAESAGGAPAGGPPGLPFLQSVPGGMRAPLSGGSPLQSAAALSAGGAALGLEAAAGEYRGIMSLCRLLPGGFEAKLAVDAAVAAIAKQVGDLLKDIQNCKAQAEAPAAPAAANPGGAALAVAPLGPHCFLDHSAYKLGGFADWVAQQPELHHLANHLTLDL